MKSLIISLVLLVAGCTTYHPLPLDRAAVEQKLETPPAKILRIQAAQVHHPILRSVPLDVRDGISPDEAAILAVLVNPSLRAARARRGLAEAQLITAGILPNPQISYTRDFVIGGNTAGTVNAFGFGASLDVIALVTRAPRRTAAQANLRSVDLDIAWEEWQMAQAARTAVYRVVGLEEQLAKAREADRGLQANVNTLKRAVEGHARTVLDLAAAEATSQDAHATALGIEQDLDKQRLVLKKTIGVAPSVSFRIQRNIALPSHLTVPSQNELIDGLEERRLDLLGLKQGYESQEATVRAAVLAQFPKISLGFNKASDTSNVHTAGFGVTFDLPIFDRNQGVIATENATRQKLFDEYTNRVFEARSDVATALSDLRALNRQIAAAGEAIPVLTRLVQTAETAMHEGNTDVLSYYTARTNLIQKSILLLKLKQQLVETESALEIAAGRYLPESLGRTK